MVAAFEWAESHDKDDIWCLFLLFQELSSVLLWTDPAGCRKPCSSSSPQLTQLWWWLFGGLRNQNLRHAIGACDLDPLCASSLTLPRGREAYVKISFGFGCYQKCLSGQMVPSGKGMLWECVVSCKWECASGSTMSRAPWGAVSASVSQRWRLEEPTECRHRNLAEFNPPGWQKTVPCGRALLLLGGPSGDQDGAKVIWHPASQMLSRISTHEKSLIQALT